MVVCLPFVTWQIKNIELKNMGYIYIDRLNIYGQLVYNYITES